MAAIIAERNPLSNAINCCSFNGWDSKDLSRNGFARGGAGRLGTFMGAGRSYTEGFLVNQ